jgi:hypothetical protein
LKNQIPKTVRKTLVPPKVLRAGFKFQVTGTMLLRKVDVDLAKLSVRGVRVQFWMRKDLLIGDVKRTLVDF